MIGVVGVGAFGTALAIALARDGTPVTLWGRSTVDIDQMVATRKSGSRLPGHDLPASLAVTSTLSDVPQLCLLAVPLQQTARFLQQVDLSDRQLVACSKGIDRSTGLGPVATIQAVYPSTEAAILSGPSFAADIASGLPTALVLASKRDAQALQQRLTRPALRIYRTTDVTGVEFGGALKNVVALAAGMTIGAGLGESARAAVVARGFAEIRRYAMRQGALDDTLAGLSGLGDLVLTCTSEKSRNFRAGQAIGSGVAPDVQATIEGLATAEALAGDPTLPLISAVHDVASGAVDIHAAMERLLSRPAHEE